MKKIKTGGRKSGTLNKVTTDLRKRIDDFLNDNWDTLQDDFNQLEPESYQIGEGGISDSWD